MNETKLRTSSVSLEVCFFLIKQTETLWTKITRIYLSPVSDEMACHGCSCSFKFTAFLRGDICYEIRYNGPVDVKYVPRRNIYSYTHTQTQTRSVDVSHVFLADSFFFPPSKKYGRVFFAFKEHYLLCTWSQTRLRSFHWTHSI